MDGWQDVAALGIVAVALGYLARLGIGAVSSKRGGAGCGSGCGACPSGPAVGPDGRGGPLVTIDPPRTPPRRAG